MAQVLLVLFAMIGIRSPQDIDCTNSRHCIDADIQATNTKSFGYNKSTSGARTIITSTNATNCTGAFSCHGVSSISSATTRCHGTNACANIDSMAANRFECGASHSCAHSTLIGTRNKSQISCTGYKSCAHSHISSTEIIIASSTYALYNATIDSLHTIHDLHVTLSGYHAGLNANITCRANDICTINCHANACYRTYINCVGTCTINTQSIDTVYPITDVSNLIDTVINLRYEPLQTPLDNDELCSKSTAISYDHYPQRYDVPMNTHQTLCCRSHKSCNQSTILVSNTTKSVVCSGSLTCGDAMSLIKHPITSNGPIYCEGAASCAHAVLSTTDSVYCLGRESCGYGTVIQNALNVFCISYGSCSHAKIITSGSGHTHHVYYLGSASDNGNYGMFHCKTNDECIVSCGGRNSCSNLTLLCDGQCTVSCDLNTVCPIGYTNNQPLNPSTRRSLAGVEVLHTCGDSDPIGTYTEGDILTFTVTMPFDGELTFDARGSNFPVTTIEAFIGTGGILGTDTDHDEIMTLDVDAGEYKFAMIGTSASTPDIYHIVIHCVSAEQTKRPTTADPTKRPIAKPTTPSPTEPGAIACGESSVGVYSNAGDPLIFSMTMPFTGELIFDASNSNFAITGIDAQTKLGTFLGSDSDNDGIVSLNHVVVGDYKFILVGDSTGIYYVQIGCVSDEPTVFPTQSPTKYPTKRPSHAPVNHPITAHPTRRPSPSPTKRPTSDPTKRLTKPPSTRTPTKAPDAPANDHETTQLQETKDNQRGDESYTGNTAGASESDPFVKYVAVITSSVIVIICLVGCVCLVKIIKGKQAVPMLHLAHVVSDTNVADKMNGTKVDAKGGVYPVEQQEHNDDDIVAAVNETPGRNINDDDVINAINKTPRKELDDMRIEENVNRSPNQVLDKMRKSEDPTDNPHIMSDIAKDEKEPGQENSNSSDNFDVMFVDADGEPSISKSDQNKALYQGTTEGVKDQKESFHGTKGDYYDEYHHQIYKERIKKHAIDREIT